MGVSSVGAWRERRQRLDRGGPCGYKSQGAARGELVPMAMTAKAQATLREEARKGNC
jgi:hypothetical protein